jgi:DNA repair/transcription protein MET18/MMS19
MPLLLRGLDLPNDEIRANVIDTLLATADPEESLESKQNSLVSEHATSLVSIMLKNSMVSDTPSPVSLCVPSKWL